MTTKRSEDTTKRDTLFLEILLPINGIGIFDDLHYATTNRFGDSKLCFTFKAQDSEKYIVDIGISHSFLS
jgi:hypothetical protein